MGAGSRAGEARQERGAHDGALFRKRVGERDGIRADPGFAELVGRKEAVVDRLVEPDTNGRVPKRINRLEEARGTGFRGMNARDGGRDLVVATHTRDLFDEVDFALEVGSPARRLGLDEVVAV